ncbi:FABP family protein [Aestuariimicrobium ganziense]|uniref:FABP family protein n=1 Tax=Aestuariimicrobium ganziense TaxID=2773677 RepID=UPI00194539F4|nr:FABP family protein [Aestuariimicrobium ganziense]
MTFEIPADLDPALMPLAWIIGRWQGNGHGTWPGQGQFEYGQQIDFTVGGGPYLTYVSQLYTIDEQGQPLEPLMAETGFWRPQPDGGLEVVLTNPEGWAEVWVGKIDGAQIQMVTDAVMRTESASIDYTGGQRLYGQVDGALMWTQDRATATEPLQTHLWARLQRA